MADLATNTPGQPTVTRRQLADALARLGIVPGDVIFVHSSLKSLGHMEAGADGVIDAMLAAVGPTGHMAVPTHSLCYVGPRREPVPYDPAVAPSRTGLITEVLRRRPGAARSAHPTHSVAALGPHADQLVAGHTPAGGTFNIDGPHGRYVRWGGKVLFIGCGLGANTTYHAAEEWLALPYMPDGQALVVRPGGPPETVIVNQPSGHRNFYRNQPPGVIDTVTDELARRGLIRQGKVAEAALLLVHSRDVIRVTVECELQSPGALLCNDPGCAFCKLARHHCIRQREQAAERGRQLLARPDLCDPAAAAERG